MIKDRIIEYARSLGIDCIGFSDTDFSNEFKERLIQRKAAGHLSGFEESDEQKRTNIKGLLENAKTIISIAIPYKQRDMDLTRPYFSKSSLGIDYHRVLTDKMNRLMDFMKLEFGAACISFVDTGPLSDREIAKKSGIGFYGKNTNIITKKYGSFVFLGEIITDLFIERDVEIDSACGDCRRCMDACPTKAIEKPYYINAKKCLSYITQKKEQLSDEEMDKMGMRLYGCDVCQDVCPFNKDAELSSLDEFKPEKWNIELEPEKILKMSNREFKEFYGKTSSGWRGKKQLQRNMIIALGNSKNKEYIPLLKMMLENPELKYYAEKAIIKLEGD